MAQQQHDRQVAARHRDRVGGPCRAEPVVELRVIVAAVAERQRCKHAAFMARNRCSQRRDERSPPRAHAALDCAPRSLPAPAHLLFLRELPGIRDVQRAQPAATLPHAAQVHRARIAVVRWRADKRRHADPITRVHAHVALQPAFAAHVHAHQPAALPARQTRVRWLAARQPLCEKTLALRRPFGLGDDIQALNRRRPVGNRQIERLRPRQRALRPERTRERNGPERQRRARQRGSAPRQPEARQQRSHQSHKRRRPA